MNRSTLKTPSRCVSSSENADEFEDHTFEDNDESRNIEAEMILAADVYGKPGVPDRAPDVHAALIESMKNLQGE